MSQTFFINIKKKNQQLACKKVLKFVTFFFTILFLKIFFCQKKRLKYIKITFFVLKAKIGLNMSKKISNLTQSICNNINQKLPKPKTPFNSQIFENHPLQKIRILMVMFWF